MDSEKERCTATVGEAFGKGLGGVREREAHVRTVSGSVWWEHRGIGSRELGRRCGSGTPL